MITLYPYENLGHANHGWLDARHHFSFARYWNPARTGFGELLVINDDTIAAGAGFPAHPHDNMEIITYVRQGAISHKDSMNHVGRTAAGDVQVMSAGTGVQHSEFNAEAEQTRLYQIWIKPNKEGVEPRWEARQFPKEVTQTGGLPLLVSGREEDADKGGAFIHQDAAIYGGRLAAGSLITQPVKHGAYVLASEGVFTVNGQEMRRGDGAEITDEKELRIHTDQDAEILVIDVPVK